MAASAHHPNRLAAFQQLHHPTGLKNGRQLLQFFERRPVATTKRPLANRRKAYSLGGGLSLAFPRVIEHLVSPGQHRIAGAKAEEARIRQESLLKGMAMSKAIYDRQRVRRQMIQMHVNDMNRVGQGDD